jgi:hypothetical protein
MRGRRSYAFEIATRRKDGQWSVVVARSSVFSRAPKATARSIAERWIFEQAGQLRGGRLVVLGRWRTARRSFDASVRIRILDRVGGRQLAVAFIGNDRDQATVVPPSPTRDEYMPATLALARSGRG